MSSIYAPVSPTAYYARFFDASGNVMPIEDGTRAQWQQLESLGFGANRAASYGKATGAVMAQDLALQLGQNSMSVRLQQLLAAGTKLGRVEVVGFADGNTSTVPTESYVFGEVGLSSYTRSSADSTAYLSYNTFAESFGSGQPAATTTFSTQGTSRLAVPSVSLAQVQASLASTGLNEVTILARFFDEKGAAILFGSERATWVRVNNPSYTLNSSGTTSTAGDATFSLDPDAAAVALEKFLLAGTSLARVELAEYRLSDGALLRDTVLGTVAIDGSSTSASGSQSLVAQLNLSYRTLSDVLRNQAADGSFSGRNTTAGWDFAGAGAALTGVTLPGDTPLTGNGLDFYTPAAPVPFFVRFFDTSGQVLIADDDKRGQWSEVVSIDFGASRAATLGATSGAASPFPLQLRLDQTSLVVKLERLLLSGTRLGRVEVVGFGYNNATSIPTESYVFGAVTVVGIKAGAVSEDRWSTSLTLTYDAFAESFGDARPAATKTFSTDGTSTLTVPNVTLTQIKASEASEIGSDIEVLARFFDGDGNPILFGASARPWIKVAAADYGLDSNGVRPNFDTLSLALSNDADAIVLAQYGLHGRPLARVELAEYNRYGQSLIRDVVFGGVLIVEQGTASGSNGPAASLSLSYNSFADRLVNRNATLTTAGTAANALPPSTRPDTSSATSPGQFYLRFIDASGTVITVDDRTGAQWIKPEYFNFGTTVSASGRVTPSPLQLTLPTNSLSLKLQQLMAVGGSIGRVEAVGFFQDGTPPDEAYVFGSVTVSSLKQPGSPGYSSVYLNYGEFAERVGSTAPPASINFTTQGFSGLPIPAVSQAQVLASLAADRFDGDETVVLARFFDASNKAIVFGTENNPWVRVSALDSRFDSNGTKAAAGDVSLTLYSDAPAVALERYLLGGTFLTRVELAEYRSVDGVGTLVRDTVLGSVALTAGVTGVNGGAPYATLALNYRTLTDNLRNLRANGSEAHPTTAGWDFMNNRSIPVAAIASDSYTADGGVACYCEGTLIRTVAGDRPVETLRAWDELVTADGAVMPVRWIGQRAYRGRFMAGRQELWPVLIRADALGPGQPARDLRVSPKHAMLLDGVFVAASLLVNGRTIVQPRCAEVTYFHVELDEHAAILAEGAPSESFVDDDSRGLFHNAASYRAIYPDAPQRPALYCAPRVDHGSALEAIRRRLNAGLGPRWQAAGSAG